MLTGQQHKSLGLVPADDANVIEQAAQATSFRVWTESTDDPRFVEVFTKMPGTDHGPFWDKCKELQEAK